MKEFSLLNDRTPTEDAVENYPANESAPVNQSRVNPAEQPEIVMTPPARPVEPQAPTFGEPEAVATVPFSPAQPIEDVEFAPQDFGQDLGVSEKFQNLSGELLRLALLGIVAVGFLLFYVLISSFSTQQTGAESTNIARRIFVNPDFRFYVFGTWILFGISAGLGLLHRFFSADASAHHLKYLRLRERLSNARVIFAPTFRRSWFERFWLYLFGSDTDDIAQQTHNERDARDWLRGVSRWLLFLSGFCLWLGSFSLILAFGLIFQLFK